MKSFYFSPKWRSSGLRIEFFCVTAGFQRSSYCVKTAEVRLAFCFNIIHFVDTQFRENLSVFLWHQNYGFCRDREMKSFYFSPKWRSSGLPIEFFCVTAGFQRSSYCLKPVEVRLAFFLCNTFCRYSVSRNISVFPLAPKLWLLQKSRNEIILFFSKMTVFRASYWILLCYCGLPTVSLFCEARLSPSGIFFI